MNRLIFACDFEDKESLMNCLKKMKFVEKPILKIGYQLFLTYGMELIRELKNEGYKIFLDLKICDTENTVKNIISKLNSEHIDYLTIYCGSGLNSLKLAHKKFKNKLLAVLLLTSMDENDTKDIYRTSFYKSSLRYFEKLTKIGYLNFVCSTDVAKKLKKINEKASFYCPGSFFYNQNKDQVQGRKFLKSMKDYVDFFIVGREIINAENPRVIYNRISKKVS
ncbi:orotidine-5'-phosphate decarboxylase [symbiont of Argiope bruennichi]|uniref:orotidine-5'-phosphate decarboxylase n=1 Tax=symbiont of Argiope bruennichi TaxID=2810479 RepID=UPI003DA3A846